MVRISFEQRPDCLIMRVEGRLVSHFADEAKHLIIGRQLAPELIVDASEVTFADSQGEEALRWLGSVGAKFVAESSYSLHLCDRLNLPLKYRHGRSREQKVKPQQRHITAETKTII